MATPVPSSQTAASTPQPLVVDEINDHERRLVIIERSLLSELEDRIAAIELFLFGP